MTANTTTKRTQHIATRRVTKRSASRKADQAPRFGPAATQGRIASGTSTTSSVGSASRAFKPRVISYLADYFPPFGEAA
jgi:hypothetical protein